MRHLIRCLSPAVLFLALAPSPARAETCVGTTPLWSHEPPLTTLVSNTGSSLLGRSYHVSGSALYAYRNAVEGGNSAGTPAWVWSPVPQATTLTNFPSPVPMHTTGSEFIYLGSTDGRLYKVNAAAPTVGTPSIDTRRPACSADKVVATPTVQLYSYSNSAYQAVHNRDLVFVVTRTGCGDMTSNRILALDASTLATQWIFNDTGAKLMDYGSEGCALDYANNRIYCGTAAGSGSQPTLWAVSTIDGSLVWSVNAGPILNRPQLCNNRVYVANAIGQVMAYNPNTGTQLWGSPVVFPNPVVRNPWPEFRAGFTTIYLTTSDGFLHAIRDLGPSAVEPWPASDAGGIGYSTMPVVMPGATQSKVYVGRKDGYIEQLDAAAGVPEVAVEAAPPGTLYDPTLDVGVAADPNPNRLLVASTHVLHRYCIPWGAAVEVRDEFHPEREGATLRPNAPNPFRESTRIDYELARPARVEIQLFDVAGKRLRQWVREHAAAGSQSITWDGTDEGGRRAPSGVYFCRLRVLDAGGRKSELARTVLRIE